MHLAITPSAPKTLPHRSFTPLRAAAAGSHRKLSFLGHLAVLSKVLLSRFWPQRRRKALRPRLFAWQFRQDFQRRGFAIAKLPPKVVEELVAAASSLRPEGGFRRSKELNEAFPASMSWHWAKDEEALSIFRPAADVLTARLGRGYELVGASFVVGEGGCEEGSSRFHLDFGPQAIPPMAAATALVPLHPRPFPETEGNLEVRPWDLAGEALMQPYREAEAVVFDGKLSHRTQPFRAEVFLERGKAATEAMPGLRVLASLSLARVWPEAPWKAAVEKVMTGYGAPLVPPLGEDQHERTQAAVAARKLSLIHI